MMLVIIKRENVVHTTIAVLRIIFLRFTLVAGGVLCCLVPSSMVIYAVESVCVYLYMQECKFIYLYTHTRTHTTLQKHKPFSLFHVRIHLIAC